MIEARDPDSWDATTMAGGELGRVRDEPRSYLLVFEGDSSRMVPLPAAGALELGRADGVDVRLQDSSVSRRHAQILVGDGQASIEDLGSQNGTRVNGERVVGRRLLVSGDSIHLGSVVLSFHSPLRVSLPHEVLGWAAFHERAQAEVERALEFQRAAVVAAVDLGLGDGPIDRFAIERAITAGLRRVDFAGWAGADQMMIVLPEREDAAAAGDELVAALRGVAPQVRVGTAVAPADGLDLDTLVSSARAASRAASPAHTLSASAATATRTVGDRQVVMADPVMVRLYELIDRLAVADLPVLVCGETGTGKELAATALHARSPRRDRPLVSLNCAAIQETLVESELFGYERGAFSGATGARAGLLESADGGTVFLDEIGELSLAVQAKLLRVLETRRLTRLGDTREREIDIRVVAATNRALDDEVQAGRFRRDLFFRLSGAMLWIPPLRDRRRELPLLARQFLDEACRRLGRPAMTLSAGAMRTLAEYSWPGNVRELKNVMDYLAAAVTDSVLAAEQVVERLRSTGSLSGEVAGLAAGFAPAARSLPIPPPPPPAHDDGGRPEPAGDPGDETGALDLGAVDPGPGDFRPLEEELRELERLRMEQALAATGGNQTRAAALISMPLRTFMAKVKQHGLSPRGKRR